MKRCSLVVGAMAGGGLGQKGQGQGPPSLTPVCIVFETITLSPIAFLTEALAHPMCHETYEIPTLKGSQKERLSASL